MATNWRAVAPEKEKLFQQQQPARWVFTRGARPPAPCREAGNNTGQRLDASSGKRRIIAPRRKPPAVIELYAIRAGPQQVNPRTLLKRSVIINKRRLFTIVGDNRGTATASHYGGRLVFDW